MNALHNADKTNRRGFLQAAGLATAAVACGPGTTSMETTRGSGPRGEWENTWDQWVEGAKKEGRLVLAMNPAVGADEMTQAFEDAFPGIKTEYQGFTSA